MRPNFVVLHVFILLFTILEVSHGHWHDFNMRFHQNSCPQLETVARDITWRRVAADPTLSAKLLRMHFHDCFVRGCDASILLDPTGNTAVEKNAIPNLLLSGYDVIDEIKAKLEEECPGTVSCADIIALAARDAIFSCADNEEISLVQKFKRSMWPVFIGRKDGRVSLASEALSNLPSPASNFTTLQQRFASNGPDVVDLVALSGAHTIGVGHCGVIARRLYNFSGKGDADPTINQNRANFLKMQFPNPPSSSTTVEMDTGSSLSFDSHYFVALNQKKGLFVSDAALLTDPRAAQISRIFQNPRVFMARFDVSTVKMGSIGVLPGENGEIRKNCWVVN